MVSLSQTATDRSIAIEHIVRQTMGPARVAMWNSHLPKGQMGINVKAQCGTEFTGAIVGNSYAVKYSDYPVWFTMQGIRPCVKCNGKGMETFIGVCRPFRIDDLPGGSPDARAAGQLL
jgi:hypothetical protein